MITSEEQWKKFLEYLDNDGLLDDQDVMDDIWQYASKDAKAFQEKGNSRIRLSFFQWREMLADRFPPDIEAPEKELIRVEQNVRYNMHTCMHACYCLRSIIFSMKSGRQGH